jgi:hypothetical protein
VTPPKVKRHLACPTEGCGHEWEVPASLSEPTACPGCGVRACGWCAGSMAGKRSNAAYCSKDHRNAARALLRPSPGKRRLTWKRSPKASRKSGKIWTYRITQKGRQKLAAGVGSRPERADGARDVPAKEPQGSAVALAGRGARSDSGGSPAPPDTSQQQSSPETPIGARSQVSGEPARLFEDVAPSAYDPYGEAA